ncbi:MAG TPA: DoxX family protein [Gemmatimonadales bacterium]|nr:DoxX family protein [Gemmatimonadales bacterium]
MSRTLTSLNIRNARLRTVARGDGNVEPTRQREPERTPATNPEPPAADPAGAPYLVPLARALFAAIFLLSTYNHFSAQTIAYAAQHGVPLAGLAVPLSGVIALAGGLSILLGYRARLGGWLLVLFLVPVTLTLHRFWGLPDPIAAQLQRIMFLKNIGLLGGALLLAYFGAGPLSLDAWRRSSSARV